MQIRPNYIIALALTPELFNQENYNKVLQTFEEYLLVNGCMGVRTLSKIDNDYNGDYNNNDDSHGFNYHNGPEWLWPLGYYLMAKINQYRFFGKDKDSDLILKQILNSKLIPHYNHLKNTYWAGLPELTNSNGSHCNGSCTTQAWSVATILEAWSKLNN